MHTRITTTVVNMFWNRTESRFVFPDDVFRDGLHWREISREEALSIADSAPVVLVIRNNAMESAAWFDRGHPLFAGVGPHAVGVTRYYRYDLQPFRESTSTSARTSDAPPVTPPIQPRVARSTPAQVRTKTWIEIELVDEDGVPVAREPYTLNLPDGDIRSGTLDSRGRARVEDIDPGTCEVSFPEIDRREWRAA